MCERAYLTVQFDTSLEARVPTEIYTSWSVHNTSCFAVADREKWIILQQQETSKRGFFVKISRNEANSSAKAAVRRTQGSFYEGRDIGLEDKVL